MKLSLTLIALLFAASTSIAQKQEKLKGSRNVTNERREIGNFENIETEDDIEIFLTLGDGPEIEIEADDNLHEAIGVSVSGNTLRISRLQEVSNAKKLAVKITYTKSLEMLIAKDEARITGLTDIDLDNFTIKLSGGARVYSNIRCKNFTLMANDKSRVEMNLKADQTTIELSKNANAKALIASPILKFDMYQKALATIEGDVNDLRLRLDNNSNFSGKNLTSKNADIVAADNSNLSVAVTNVATIEASGKADIELHGEQKKIEIRKFADNSSIRKKASKVSN